MRRTRLLSVGKCVTRMFQVSFWIDKHFDLIRFTNVFELGIERFVFFCCCSSLLFKTERVLDSKKKQWIINSTLVGITSPEPVEIYSPTIIARILYFLRCCCCQRYTSPWATESNGACDSSEWRSETFKYILLYLSLTYVKKMSNFRYFLIDAIDWTRFHFQTCLSRTFTNSFRTKRKKKLLDFSFDLLHLFRL